MPKRKFWVVRVGSVMLLLGAAVAGGQASPPAPDPDEAAVRKVIADYGEAWNKHDPNATLSLFTNDPTG